MKKPNSEWKIVEFQQKYREAVIKLIDRSLKHLKVIPDNDELIDDEDLFMIPKTYSGKGKFWIALDRGEVIGTVAVRDLGDNKAKLNRMFIGQDFYGSGLGQELLNTALDHARNQGIKEINLNTHLLMKRAHYFYEKNGFKRTGVGKDIYLYKLEL